MPGRQLPSVVVTTTAIISLQFVSSVTPIATFLSNANIGIIAPTLASTPLYVPPNVGTPQSTAAGGSRGCSKSIPASITLLVANNHIGQTISERPTFSWYVSNPTAGAVPMQFALVEPGVASPLLVKSLQADKTGLVQLELPKNAPGLQPKHQYRWTVSLTCNAKRPSENIYATSWIERVTTTAEQAKAIMKASSDNERAQVYAHSGLWYDAFTAMSKAYQTNPHDRSTSESLISLLDQVGLTQVAMQERQRISEK